MRIIHRLPELLRCLLWGAFLAAALAWVDVLFRAAGARPTVAWWERAQLAWHSAGYLLVCLEGSFILWWILTLLLASRKRLDGREDDLGRRPPRVVPAAAFWALAIFVLARADYSDRWVWKAILWGLVAMLLAGWIMTPRRRFDDLPRGEVRSLGAIAVAAAAALLIWAPTWFLAGRDPAILAPRWAPHSEPRENPNFVLVVIDTLRADHLGSYGYFRPTTPAMDELAGRGARFERAISPSSWTLPSMASIFTSRYPATHGADREDARLPRGLDDLATQMRQAGYRTAGFSTNPWLNRVFGFDDGFTTYHDNARLTIRRETAGVRLKNLLMRRLGKIRRDPEEFPVAEEVTTWGERWLRQQGDGPFFLYLHYMDVHHPYLPQPRYRGIFCKGHRFSEPDHELENKFRMKEIEWSQELLDHMVERYDEELVATDEAIGRLVRVLQELNLDETTAIVITSDHGEEFYDHGGTGHRRTVYQEVVRVPLIVVPPGAGFDPGRVVGERVSTLDIMPTLIHWGGGTLPLSADGESLRKFLRPDQAVIQVAGEEVEPPRAIGSQLYYEQRAWTALFLEDDKLIRVTPPPSDPASETSVELYQLSRDPGEKINSVELDPNRFDLLLDLMTALDDQWGVPGEKPVDAGEPIDEETLETLRGLGYIK